LLPLSLEGGELVLFFYLIVLSATAFYKTRKKFFLLLIPLLITLIQAAFLLGEQNSQSNQIEFCREGKRICIPSSSVSLGFWVDGDSLASIQNHELAIDAYKLGKLRILNLRKWHPSNPKKKLYCDILILSGPFPSHANWKSIRQGIRFKQVILHQNYYSRKTQQWIEVLAEDSHDVAAHSMRRGWLSIASMPAE
jgi:hypothetical protein